MLSTALFALVAAASEPLQSFQTCEQDDTLCANTNQGVGFTPDGNFLFATFKCSALLFKRDGDKFAKISSYVSDLCLENGSFLSGSIGRVGVDNRTNTLVAAATYNRGMTLLFEANLDEPNPTLRVQRHFTGGFGLASATSGDGRFVAWTYEGDGVGNLQFVSIRERVNATAFGELTSIRGRGKQTGSDLDWDFLDWLKGVAIGTGSDGVPVFAVCDVAQATEPKADSNAVSIWRQDEKTRSWGVFQEFYPGPGNWTEQNPNGCGGMWASPNLDIIVADLFNLGPTVFERHGAKWKNAGQLKDSCGPFSVTSTSIVTTVADGARVWKRNTATGVWETASNVNFGYRVNGFALSPDGQLLAVQASHQKCEKCEPDSASLDIYQL